MIYFLFVTTAICKASRSDVVRWEKFVGFFGDKSQGYSFIHTLALEMLSCNVFLKYLNSVILVEHPESSTKFCESLITGHICFQVNLHVKLWGNNFMQRISWIRNLWCWYRFFWLKVNLIWVLVNWYFKYCKMLYIYIFIYITISYNCF